MDFRGHACAVMLGAFPKRLAKVALLVAAMSLVACAVAPARNPLATWVPSPNFGERRAQLIVLHFTDETSAQKALQTLRTGNSGGPVSAHYLIGDDGHIYQLVADSMRAWHAGAGRWGTITDVNSASIGIELDNDGSAPFAPAQINSLLRLLTDLTDRLRIPRTQVIGHEDFAPTRKTDPGPLFPWKQLADAGFGLWPQGTLIDPPPGFDPWLALSVVGYPPDERTSVVHAFHDHYRGAASSDGSGSVLDADDLRILYALERQLSSQPLSPRTGDPDGDQGLP
jgi:N-acetylmuramoyl-L-alanine amidase